MVGTIKFSVDEFQQFYQVFFNNFFLCAHFQQNQVSVNSHGNIDSRQSPLKIHSKKMQRD